MSTNDWARNRIKYDMEQQTLLSSLSHSYNTSIVESLTIENSNSIDKPGEWKFNKIVLTSCKSCFYNFLFFIKQSYYYIIFENLNENFITQIIRPNYLLDTIDTRTLFLFTIGVYNDNIILIKKWKIIMNILYIFIFKLKYC